MKYGIAIFPSKKIQDEANALRMRYDPEYSQIAPHITLKSGFNMGDALRKKVIEALNQIARETKPFTINIEKVSTFAPVTNTIYFKIEPIAELDELHQKMHEGVFPTEREHPFVPHITVSQDLSDEEYHDVFDSMKMKDVALEDTVDRVHLCYQLENGSWQVYETFKFGDH